MPERKPLDDRQLDAVLERLDKLIEEITSSTGGSTTPRASPAWRTSSGT